MIKEDYDKYLDIIHWLKTMGAPPITVEAFDSGIGKLEAYFLNEKDKAPERPVERKKPHLIGSRFNPMKALLIVLVLFALKAPAQEITSEFGDSIDCYNGIVVHDGFDKYEYDSDYKYGLYWQCAEYAERYMDQVYGCPLYKKYYRRAKQLYASGLMDGGDYGYGLIQCSYWSKIPFKTGQAVVMGGFGPGHVAIICEVGADYIVVVSENQIPVRWKIPTYHYKGMWTVLTRHYKCRLAAKCDTDINLK